MIGSPVLRRMVELACFAPSVHNTQPWLWRAHGDRVRLYADRARLLTAEDPLGRNLVLSCGAALDHLLVAARAFGFDADVVRLPHGNDSDLLADVRLRPGTPAEDPAEDIRLLRTRHTDRRRFTSWPVREDDLERLAAAARTRGAAAIAVTDASARFRLEVLAQRAHVLRELDRDALLEQRAWVGTRQADGVPVAVLPAVRGPAAARFESGTAPETRQLVTSSDGVIALGSVADDPLAWLRSGEALSALWLLATRDGLSVVPLSLPIEVTPIRAGVHASVLDGAVLPHLLLRIGWQAIARTDLPRTPRRPVDDVLHTR